MPSATRYEQLQPEDRMTIASMRQQSVGVRAIARVLGRSPSTISREVARNTPVDAAYGSHRAELACKARRRQAHPIARQRHPANARLGIAIGDA